MNKSAPKKFLTAEWKHLAMLNFEIESSLLQPFVPIGTELDRWNGKLLISVVGFLFLKARVFGISIPYHRNFEEVNLRFYVRHKGEDLRLLLADGSQICGADVYRYAARRIWWAWPVYLFSVTPGLRNVFDWGYRTFAVNRFRVSSACGLGLEK